MNNWQRSSRFLVAAITVFVLAGSTFAATSADGARPPKQSSRTYRLSVKFEGNYREEAQDVDQLGAVSGEKETDSTFVGTSSRFLLIRAGTASNPSYTLAAADGTPLLLRITGQLGFAGSGHYAFGGSRACSYDVTLAIKGDRYAAVGITLVKNRLWLSISSDATVVQHDSAGCGPAKTWTYRDGTGLYLSPRDPSEAAWSKKFDAISLKQVRFGKSFTLVRSRDAISDPTMLRTFNNGKGEQRWSYSWKLRFMPV